MKQPRSTSRVASHAPDAKWMSFPGGARLGLGTKSARNGFLFLLAAATFLAWQPAQGQGTRADYERAETLRERTRGKVFRTGLNIHWLDEGARLWYRLDLPEGRTEFIQVETATGQRQRAFDHDRLAATLSVALGEAIPPDKLPLEGVRIEADLLRFRAGGQGWRCSLDDYALEQAEVNRPDSDEEEDRRRRRRGRRPRRGGSEASSPDERWTALIEDHNVILRRQEDGEEFALSSDGTEEDGFIPRFYWAPDSRHLVVMRRQAGQDRQIYLLESAPEDQLQPKLHKVDYRKPGDRIPMTKPHLFHVESRRAVELDDSLYEQPWRISRLRWMPDSSEFRFLYNQRGHQVLRVVGVKAGDGSVRAIIEETSDTFIDYAHKTYLNTIDATGEILWMSERDGWNHLYLYDGRDGKVKHQITRGEWVVREVERVDEEQRQIWFRAGGIRPGQDPYYVHHARINFDGSGLVILTEGEGTHAVEFAPDRRHFVDRWSRVDLPTVTELRRSDDGGLVAVLERGDASALLRTGWRPPERFVAKGRDGETDIYGVIHHPIQLAQRRKYPVIEKIYAGPQGAFVPKRWRDYYREQALAELGFIVVQIDGMGTSHRSKAFHDVCWKNLKDAGFPDRIPWLKAAAAERPYMDLDRVGLYGGSAGGQSTVGGLLFHPDFYKVGVADCGCHDNRMDKIWWNELWMGWPVGPAYEENSNVTHAHKLEGKLFLTVGELDRNVDPASTLQLVDALIDAGKDFDFLMVPGAGHGVGGSSYLRRRRADFFVRHLLGVQPRSN